MTDTNKAQQGLTADLAAYVAHATFADFPEIVVQNAKLAILDTVACALAAARFQVGSIVINSVRDSGESGRATVWPSGFRTSAATAAYVNGQLSNALDFDNSLHLDTHVLPAGLAVAEQQKVSGVEFLVAYLAAREVGARLMRALDGKRTQGQGVSHRGWWHVGLVAPLDASLVAARLIGLDQEKMRITLGIASCSVGGFRRNLGTMAKSLHSGKAARDGVQAAMLAEQGFTGDPEIMEAPMGLIEALCPAGEFDYDAIYDGLGTRYTLSAKPKLKPYPACGPAIAQIDSVLEILETYHVDPADIVHVDVDFHEHSLFRTQAGDEVEAGFSTPYIIAVTFIDGRFGLDQLTQPKIRDARVRALMERIHRDPEAPGGQVTVHLRDGRQLSAGSDVRRWLDSWEEAAEKFAVAAEGQITPAAVDEFRDILAELEKCPFVADLPDILYRGAILAR